MDRKNNDSGNPFFNVSWRNNIYVALIMSLGLVMGLYSLSRIAFYFFNLTFFPGMTASRFATILRGGLLFDLTAVLYCNSLFVLLIILPFSFRYTKWYKLMLKWIFIVTNSIALAANTVDFIYYRFTLRRTTAIVFSQFKNEQNKLSLFYHFLIDYWYGFVFLAVLIWVMAWLYEKIKFEGPQIKKVWLYYVVSVAIMPLVVHLFIGGVRGGFIQGGSIGGAWGGFLQNTRPLALSNAGAYAEEHQDISLVLNTPFSLIRTIKASAIKKVDYFPDQEVAKVFNPLKVPSDTIPFKYDNVVIIIIESFSKEFIGKYNTWLDHGTYKGYTPFLDSLIGVSRAFEFSMANGRRSLEAPPSVICSIPTFEESYMFTNFSVNKVNSLANLLKEKGYYSAFFHGAANGSMAFDNFAGLSGFHDYFGKDEYNQDADYDGTWGIWDHKFLQYYANSMNTFKEPFFTTLFTVSSHHPFKIPAEYDTKFKGGDLDIYKAIEYTDYSLSEFFKTASKMPWYKNTLFVFTADHAAPEIGRQEYNTAWGYFSIPIFFYKPGSNWGSFSPEIIQQLDIMPTVLGYLHYDKPYVAFGRNVFSTKERPFALNYLDQTYQAFQGDFLLQFDGNRSYALYNFKSDKSLQTNLLNTLPDTVRIMELKLKGLIQQYNNRMVDDDLTREGSQAKKNR